MLTWLKKYIPSWALQLYHWKLAWLAALVYGFPSERLIVIGVTGTKGKSTTVHLITQLLEGAGFRVGATSTVGFKVAEREWPNAKKMTMLGRFSLQRLLRQMVRAGCRYAVIETSSQGIAQYRHIAINYDLAVFTNLTPEHLEAHGGFLNYQRAKEELFSHLTRRRRKQITGKTIEKVIVVNGADEHANAFLRYPADRKYLYSLFGHVGPQQLVACNLELGTRNSSFEISGVQYELPLPGKFNALNALAAISVCLSQGLSLEQCRDALRQAKPVPGRLEFIEAGQPFTVIVDYAHEPASVQALYEFIEQSQMENEKFKMKNEASKSPDALSASGRKLPSATLIGVGLGEFASGQASKILHLLGSAGGGRDASRRTVLGALAAAHANVVIATNEDPYDEDPKRIIRQVADGARAYLAEHPERTDVTILEIADRREAIRTALHRAQPGDVVLLTGKGSEQVMAVAGGKLVPWDDRKVTREELRRL